MCGSVMMPPRDNNRVHTTNVVRRAMSFKEVFKVVEVVRLELVEILYRFF